MKKMCFIVNPRSGKVQIKPHLMDVLQIFNEAEYDVNVHITLYCGHAIEIAQSLPDDIDLVAVSGGDGTLNEVLTGLQKSGKKLPVGYIPAGSTNDFANTFGIATDPLKAAKQITEGTGKTIDVGNFNGSRYFSYIASFGIFTAASYNTPQITKNAFGHLAYVLEGMKDITKISPYKVRVETDDRIYDGRYIFGSVTNTTSVGGIVKLDKELVKMNDGLFEIVLVKYPANINDISKIIMGCTNSNFSDPVFEFVKSSKVKFTFEDSINWSVDGEQETTGTTVNIENCMHAATIIR